MYRLLLFSVVVAAFVVWFGLPALAEENEFQLPPVKLKPDRPTTTEPIPPSPDDRAPPAEKPPTAPKESPPAEKPKETPKETPPAEKPLTAPKKAPPVETPAEPPKKAPALEPPAPPELPPLPPKKTAKAPKEAAPPELPPPPVIAEPVGPPKVARPVELDLPEGIAREPKPTELQAQAVEAQVRPTPEVDLTGMGEVGLVEEVARTRKAYARALVSLKDFYLARGTVHKIEWATSELEAFEKVPKIQYLAVAELAGSELRPVRRIAAADQLFTEGTHYKNYPAFPPAKKDYLKIALEKFQTVIEKFPESDKIDDAAFRIGEIYGGWYFEDWARAVQAYERCWQWDPKTEYPAVFNAAKIYEEKLKNREKAVELYNRVVAESRNDDLVKQAQERIKAVTGR